MLTPFDDFPIHPSADPIAHPATGDPNHYDRYWFNGHQRDGEFYFGAAMGHYPVRCVIDAAFSIILDGVEHSIFASGRMPLDRSTAVGPIRIEVLEPLRRIRYVVAENDQGITADVTFEASTVAIEEPRQRRFRPDGTLVMDNTRLTQWGRWSGQVTVDGRVVEIDAEQVPGTRDRSWGTRPVGAPTPTNREQETPRVFWLWAPLHFEDRFTHLALHELPTGERWLESALVLEPLGAGDPVSGTKGVTECHGIRYELDWEPGRREIRSAAIEFEHPVEGRTRIELEKLYTFRMRGIGYSHPYWAHGSPHGELEVGRESIALADFDPLLPNNLHLQNVVKVRMGERTGIGVLEQIHMGPHAPTGLTGVFDGFQPGSTGA